MVARLIPLLLVLAALLIVFVARQQAQTTRPRSDRTYRPRKNPGGRSGVPGWSHADDEGSDRTVLRSELDGVRDAYSSAALDASKPLLRCAGCQAFYHRASADALGVHNHGRCVLCGSTDLRAVRVR
jgi:hypothetical protein